MIIQLVATSCDMKIKSQGKGHPIICHGRHRGRAVLHLHLLMLLTLDEGE